MNNIIYLKDVVTLQLDENKCTGCGMCLEVCPHEVFKMNDSHAVIQNRDACMECGACSRNCPFGAISVEAGVGCAAAVINSLLGRCCHLGMHDIEQSVLPRIPDQDEAVFVQAVGIVGTERIVKCRGGFVERNAMFLEIRRCLSLVPDTAHVINV